MLQNKLVFIGWNILEFSQSKQGRQGDGISIKLFSQKKFQMTKIIIGNVSDIKHFQSRNACWQTKQQVSSWNLSSALKIFFPSLVGFRFQTNKPNSWTKFSDIHQRIEHLEWQFSIFSDAVKMQRMPVIFVFDVIAKRVMVC